MRPPAFRFAILLVELVDASYCRKKAMLTPDDIAGDGKQMIGGDQSSRRYGGCLINNCSFDQALNCLDSASLWKISTAVLGLSYTDIHQLRDITPGWHSAYR